jgi:uncharacterized membrane protein YdcZ (DUF606 family)
LELAVQPPLLGDPYTDHPALALLPGFLGIALVIGNSVGLEKLDLLVVNALVQQALLLLGFIDTT